MHVPLTREARRRSEATDAGDEQSSKTVRRRTYHASGKRHRVGMLLSLHDCGRRTASGSKAQERLLQTRKTQNMRTSRAILRCMSFINVRHETEGLIETTVGRILVNEQLPGDDPISKRSAGKSNSQKLCVICLKWKGGGDGSTLGQY